MKTAVLLAGTLCLPALGNAQSATPRDGQRDFDWEIGSWQTHVRVLAKPLSNSAEWIELSGTTVVHRLLDGKSNLAELKVKNAERSIEGVSLRLYNPATRQWSLHYASSRSGQLEKPVMGSFENGRGEFYAQDSYDGRAVFVRFVITPMSEHSWRFEQAYSVDGGKSWETNWIATDTRMK
jgi:hypothetical protein